jgi:hypothetical protein
MKHIETECPEYAEGEPIDTWETPDAHGPLGMHQYGHSHCLMCGRRNPDSLRLDFHLCEDGRVCARFRGNARLQGYDGILHGGIVGALLDAAMTHCLFSRGIQAVTGDLRVRFRKPVPCNATLDIRAWLASESPPLYRLKSELLRGPEVMAWAKASFMRSSLPDGSQR